MHYQNDAAQLFWIHADQYETLFKWGEMCIAADVDEAQLNSWQQKPHLL